MAYYDERLQSLAMQTAQKQQLERELKELEDQRLKLDKKVLTLDIQKKSELQDVERLEKRSLTTFFYQVIGKMDSMLTKEKEEAYAAAVHCDAAVKELAAVDMDIQRIRESLRHLRDCEQQYKELLAAKYEAIRSSDSADAEEILRLEGETVRLDHHMQEIREAIAAGRRAKHAAARAISSLDDANSCATWDVLGGGLFADMAKHASLDDAQEMVEQLQIGLRRFKTELSDISIRCDTDVRIDGFLGFADYFFDGLFADWAVKDKIGRALSRMRDTENQIENVLRTLDRTLDDAVRAKDNILHRIDDLVLNATL